MDDAGTRRYRRSATGLPARLGGVKHTFPLRGRCHPEGMTDEVVQPLANTRRIKEGSRKRAGRPSADRRSSMQPQTQSSPLTAQSAVSPRVKGEALVGAGRSPARRRHPRKEKHERTFPTPCELLAQACGSPQAKRRSGARCGFAAPCRARRNGQRGCAHAIRANAAPAALL